MLDIKIGWISPKFQLSFHFLLRPTETNARQWTITMSFFMCSLHLVIWDECKTENANVNTRNLAKPVYYPQALWEGRLDFLLIVICAKHIHARNLPYIVFLLRQMKDKIFSYEKNKFITRLRCANLDKLLLNTYLQKIEII